jgi:hypothetical protein
MCNYALNYFFINLKNFQKLLYHSNSYLHYKNDKCTHIKIERLYKKKFWGKWNATYLLWCPKNINLYIILLITTKSQIFNDFAN